MSFEQNNSNISNFDAFIQDIRNAFMSKNKLPSIINPERLKEFANCYAVLKYILKDTDAEISYEVMDIFGVGSISVLADVIAISNTDILSKLFSVADNAEVNPLTNGKVEMTFSFYRMSLNSI